MSNALGRDLAKLVAAVDAAASECGHGAYGQRFHIMPPAGWLNDPNGLCQAGGVFHAYFQYAPFDVEGGRRSREIPARQKGLHHLRVPAAAPGMPATGQRSKVYTTS